MKVGVFEEAGDCFNNPEFGFAEERSNGVRGVNVDFLDFEVRAILKGAYLEHSHRTWSSRSSIAPQVQYGESVRFFRNRL